jgi:hypothetical protein
MSEEEMEEAERMRFDDPDADEEVGPVPREQKSAGAEQSLGSRG